MQRRVLLLALVSASAATPAFALLDSLTQGDASRGIKDALSLAATNATGRLGQRDGFWGAPRVRIPLPGMLGTAQQNLQRFGMSQPLDDLQLSLNRAAETTMPQAGRMFVNAVRTITVSDAIGIVRGGDNSATQYLRGRTETGLTGLLRPPMTTALTQSGAFTLMRSALRQVGMSSQATSMRTQIVDFATSKALDACFAYIGDEERAIRRDPVRRTTDILRRVFG
jgi:hypothetical protein